MKTPASLIEKVIEAHDLNTLAAWDTHERLRLFYREGSPDELIGDLGDLVRSLDGVFLVKAWRRSGNVKGGRRKQGEEVYSWHVAGSKAPPAEAIGALPGGVPESVINELAELRAEKMLRERMESEEEEEEEEPGKPDPMDKLVEVLSGFLSAKFGVPGAGAPAAAAAVTGAERGHPSALTQQRMAAILQAVRNLHDSDPATFSQYESALLSTYGKAS